MSTHRIKTARDFGSYSERNGCFYVVVEEKKLEPDLYFNIDNYWQITDGMPARSKENEKSKCKTQVRISKSGKKWSGWGHMLQLASWGSGQMIEQESLKMALQSLILDK